MFIHSVTVKNFRSIQNQTVLLSQLNVFVGNNDVGKSNFLKALNLFFNGETDNGQSFNFKNDFCSFATTPNKKAPEIVIELVFNPPVTFREPRKVVWKKIWRTDGFYESYKRYSDNSPLESRKKIGFWLDQIKYAYVPAIKGQEYFSRLLGDLHDVLIGTVEAELKTASEGFINQIRKHTKQISKDLAQRLGFDSSLQIPPDLSALFQVLDFETSRENRNVSLKFRGDGIKIRHIPVILKFIHEQRNINKAKGAIKSNTVWGYEEPENNLELSRAFDHAVELIEYSDTIQILLTTHSPAFYSIKNHSEVNSKTYVVKQQQNSPGSIVSEFDSEDITSLDTEMGLLPFITPHISNLLDEKELLLRQIKKTEKILSDLNSETLFVEGESDKRFLERAIEFHYPLMKNKFQIQVSNSGANGVADMVIAWFFSRKSKLAVGLFDSDGAGKDAKDRVHKTVSSNKKNFRTVTVSKVPHIQNIFKKGITLSYAIEDLFSHDVLNHCIGKGWMEFKSDLIASHLKDHSISFEQYCINSLKFSNEELPYLYKVKFIHKSNFCEYVLGLKDTDQRRVFDSFKYLIKDILESFGAIETSDLRLKLE